jgi:hypothetical protein
MKGTSILKYKDYHIGDYFIITKRPISWNSRLHDNSPFDIEVPYYGKITKMFDMSDIYGIAMTDGCYGFSLDTMVDRLEIIKNKTKNRRLKLLKLG